MKIVEFSVNRPVTTTMFFLAVIMVGFICFAKLPQELFPPLTYPQLTVITNYPNAAPEEIENLITKSVEEALATVKNVKKINSVSKEGLSLVTAEFLWGTDMDFAALGAREKIDLIKEKLPQESEEPLIMKLDPFAMPAMIISITGNLSSYELLQTSKGIIKDRLEKIEGVASISISGGREREISVEVDQGRLKACKISIVSIVESLKNSNLNYPAGTTDEKTYQYLTRTMGEFKEISEIGETVIAKDKHHLILLSQVAKVKEILKERESYSRFNGQENISLSIQKQPAANTIKTAKKIRREINNLKKILPKDIQMEIIYDLSSFIENSIQGTRNAALNGGILAFLVLLFFLRDWRKSLIVTFSIPVSIMAVFCLMYFKGFSINMMSLGGLALGIGMMVDNAIVVIENTLRHRQAGKEIKQATIDGTNEVIGAIFSSTLTTIAVFLPLAFVSGIPGQLFRELSFTITFSLIVSLIVAMTLIPRLLVVSSSIIPLRELPRWTKIQQNLLKLFLTKKKKSFGLIILLFLSSVVVLLMVERQFMPKIDQRQFMLKVNMPVGTKLEVTDLVTGKIEKILSTFSEIKNVTVSVGSWEKHLENLGMHQSQIIVDLKAKKKKETKEVIYRLKQKLQQENLMNAQIEYILAESMFKSLFKTSSPIEIVVKGDDFKMLEKITKKLMKKIEKIKGVYGVKSDLTPSAPETKLVVNREKAASYNLSVANIAHTALIGLKGYVATKFKQEGKEIDIRVRLRKEDREDVGKLRELLIYSPLDINVSLAEVAKLSVGRGPSEIKRMDQQRTIVISAQVFKRSLNAVLKDVDNSLEDFQKISGYTMNLAGEREKIKESFRNLLFILLFSLLLVYMIMAAQFESLWQPLVIIFTFPLSIIGIALAIFVTHTPLSIMVFLGMIILGGIVVNNGIVLVDCIDHLKRQGRKTYDALFLASAMRLRPILMTTLTTVLGLFPLALGLGEGAELRAPLAITVIGGLTMATVLTLLVIPSLYMIVEKIGKRK